MASVSSRCPRGPRDDPGSAIPAFNLHARLAGDYSKAALLSSWDKRYLAGFVVLQVTTIVVFPTTGLEERLPFAPLALTSLYCAVGILAASLPFYRETLATR